MSDWESLTDPEGRTYYYNSKTNETSWTLPGASVWKEYSTEDGKQYYYNESTGVTTWDKPEDYEAKEELKELEGEPKEEQLGEHLKDQLEGHLKEVEVITTSETELDKELATQPIKNDTLLHPPEFDSFANAEKAFLNLLNDNDVDSTWSFQAVMHKFIKEPVYWSIPDALHRKKLYDDYLVSKFREELSDKNLVVEKFEKNFLQVLKGYEDKGKIKYNTRWSFIKNLLISEDNPIFKHSILSDHEISKIYNSFIANLKKIHDDDIHTKKSQALSELESYLTQINPTIVQDTKNWQELYERLLNDSRFQANKHFNILNKVDILDLYQTKIYPTIIQEIKDQIKIIEKTNLRTDRKARANFKVLLQGQKISANSLFKDIFPTLENEDAFIELCGRNGSTPLELFWDIVDDKHQLLKLKKDLVKGVLLDLRKSQNITLESLLLSKETFINKLASLKDDRLASFDIHVTPETDEDNEIEVIYETLRRDFEYEREQSKVQAEKELKNAIDSFCDWLYYNLSKQDIIEIGEKTTKPVCIKSSQETYTISEYDEETVKGEFSKLAEFQPIQTILSREVSFSQNIIKDILDTFVVQLTRRASKKRNREVYDYDSRSTKKPKVEDDKPKPKAPILNY